MGRADPLALSVSPAQRWAQLLLGALGKSVPARFCTALDASPPSVFAQASPQHFPLPVSACADGALAALSVIAPAGSLARRRGSEELFARARLGALPDAGTRCRLLHTADGMLAVNLPRESDWSLLPAWLETSMPADWATLSAELAHRAARPLLDRAREIGLAVAASPAGATSAPEDIASQPVTGALRAVPRGASRRGRPRVLDLSSLWAGPLCAQLLLACGADVIKLESTQRPDGARRGAQKFFEHLNVGKRRLALDLHTGAGRARLRELIAEADIVIESSRPRALRQMGVVAEDFVREHGTVWLSITAYGRGEPQAQWIGYGDDTAVAAGFSAAMREHCGEALIVGDALSDPLTGLHGALLAWAAWRSGQGVLLGLPLAGTARECLEFLLRDAPAPCTTEQAFFIPNP